MTLAAQAGEMRPIQELQVWITHNLGRRDLGTSALAERTSPGAVRATRRRERAVTSRA